MHLYSLVDTSEMKLDDLVQVARQRVEDGIPAEDRADADRILANLSGQQKQPCPTATPTPTPTRSPAQKPGLRPPPPPTTTPAPATAPTPTTSAAPPDDEGCRR